MCKVGYLRELSRNPSDRSPLIFRGPAPKDEADRRKTARPISGTAAVGRQSPRPCHSGASAAILKADGLPSAFSIANAGSGRLLPGRTVALFEARRRIPLHVKGGIPSLHWRTINHASGLPGSRRRAISREYAGCAMRLLPSLWPPQWAQREREDVSTLRPTGIGVITLV